MQVSKELLTKIRESVDFFASFNSGELFSLVQIAEEGNFEPGETIFEEGEEGERFFIVKEGEVEISRIGKKDEKEVLIILKEGDCFGEMGVLGELNRTATATAGEKGATTMSLSGKILTEKNRDVALKLYRNFAIMLAVRLSENNRKLDKARKKVAKLKAKAED